MLLGRRDVGDLHRPPFLCKAENGVADVETKNRGKAGASKRMLVVSNLSSALRENGFGRRTLPKTEKNGCPLRCDAKMPLNSDDETMDSSLGLGVRTKANQVFVQDLQRTDEE